MSIRRDLLLRTALLRLPDLVALRAAAPAGPAGLGASGAARKPPGLRRLPRRSAPTKAKA